jgi:hypothetical protein
MEYCRDGVSGKNCRYRTPVASILAAAGMPVLCEM